MVTLLKFKSIWKIAVLVWGWLTHVFCLIFFALSVGIQLHKLRGISRNPDVLASIQPFDWEQLKE